MSETSVPPVSAGEQAVRDLVKTWYEALDRHDPVEQVLPYLVDEGLEMKFPEATLRSIEEFKGWYEAVTHRFFDEIHELVSVELTPLADGSGDEVKVVVNWQAHIWDRPEPHSKWLGFDAYQTWVVVSDEQGKPRVKTYSVDRLAPMAGSAAL